MVFHEDCKKVSIQLTERLTPSEEGFDGFGGARVGIVHDARVPHGIDDMLSAEAAKAGRSPMSGQVNPI